jgi:DNA-binding response OmpR family regulator
MTIPICATALVEQLSLHEEFEACMVDTGAKGALAAKSNSPDLVLMDVGLPDTDGREVAQPAQGRLQVADHHADRPRHRFGHDSGLESARTTMWRSRSFSPCCWRASGAQLRQHEASEDAVFTVGPYSFRPGSKMPTGANAKKVRLTEKETAILRFLYRAGQMPVSRETLLQEVWGYNSGVTTHTLETHIYRLRQKVEKDAANPEILVTDPGL